MRLLAMLVYMLHCAKVFSVMTSSDLPYDDILVQCVQTPPRQVGHLISFAENVGQGRTEDDWTWILGTCIPGTCTVLDIGGKMELLRGFLHEQSLEEFPPKGTSLRTYMLTHTIKATIIVLHDLVGGPIHGFIPNISVGTFVY
jgi:hypothetical protein